MPTKKLYSRSKNRMPKPKRSVCNKNKSSKSSRLLKTPGRSWKKNAKLSKLHWNKLKKRKRRRFVKPRRFVLKRSREQNY